jgi:hypothetical protein
VKYHFIFSENSDCYSGMFSPTQELPKYSADAIELGEVYLKSEGEALGATNRYVAFLTFPTSFR